MNDAEIERLAAEYIAADWTPDRYYRDMNVTAFARALLAATPPAAVPGAITDHERNAPYIAAASPDQVLKLIAVCRAAQEWADVADSPIEDMERATKARDALRSALAALKDKPND